MKKLIYMLLISIIILSCSCTAFSDSLSYDITQLNLQIAFPETFTILTRDVVEGSPDLQTVNMDKTAFLDFCVANHIYLYAKDSNSGVEIIVTMIENEQTESIYDFNLYEDKQLESMANNILGMDSNQLKQSANLTADITISDTQQMAVNGFFILKIDRALYIVYDTSKQTELSKTYGRQYTTIINAQGINITMQSHQGEVTKQQAEALEGIVRSIKFAEVAKEVQGGNNSPTTSFEEVQIPEEQIPAGNEAKSVYNVSVLEFAVFSVLLFILFVMVAMLIQNNIRYKKHTEHTHHTHYTRTMGKSRTRRRN